MSKKVEAAAEEIILLLDELGSPENMTIEDYQELLEELISNFEMKLAAAKNESYNPL